MRMTDIIEKKRDRLPLSENEIKFFVSGVTDGSIPDYQISALLMAILLNGMNREETLLLTNEMAKSGDMLDLSSLPHTADKHSTGGVGDKTTLIAAPAAAAMGCTVAKMSGRGLGFTGGTVDKLESITGYNTAVTTEVFMRTARREGICIVGQSGNFAPADKRLYAIRDVTATVNSIPLIASSIMSKKLAAGAETIVLDVKFGSGAFMKTAADAVRLAEEMVSIGRGAGRKTAAVITDMDSPLGRAVGNALEVKEAVSVLKGRGPDDLKELSVLLAAQMYKLSFGASEKESLEKANRVISDGSAFSKLKNAAAAMGGDAGLLTGEREFPAAGGSKEIYAAESGYITSLDSETVGKASGMTGAGRETLKDKIDYSAGILLDKKYGDRVEKGERLAVLYGSPERLEDAAAALMSAYSYGSKKPPEKSLVYKIIS